MAFVLFISGRILYRAAERRARSRNRGGFRHLTEKKNASCVAWSGRGRPAAPIARPLSLLTIIEARLGSTRAASKCWRDSPPLRWASSWHTAQYFLDQRVLCCDR